MAATEPAIRVVPASEAAWEDLQAVFGTRGPAARCQCQRYKLRPREHFAGFPVEERARRLREQTACGHPEAGTTSGLVAYLGDDPAGWCAVEPRPAFARRICRVAQGGRPVRPVECSSNEVIWECPLPSSAIYGSRAPTRPARTFARCRRR